MTRGLYPPDTLSKDDVRTLQELRKDIYSSAVIGAGFGCSSGFVLHTGLQMAKKYGLWNGKLNKNTAMLSVLGCGALGMFLGATKTGKESVHNLHPIFQVGAVPQPKFDDKMDYRQTLQRGQGGGEDARALEKTRLTARNSESSSVPMDNDDPTIIDIHELEETRVLRRQSLMNRIEKGHGISDAHGGRWYRDPDKQEVDINELKQIQLLRRKSLSERIKQGHGLSDSHGGHWVRETGK